MKEKSMDDNENTVEHETGKTEEKQGRLHFGKARHSLNDFTRY